MTCPTCNEKLILIDVNLYECKYCGEFLDLENEYIE
jgi:hypothetical protein